MALKWFQQADKKACVVGLDGVPYSMLHSLIDRGVMPRTAQILADGRLETMDVSLPEISSVSWTTFMTAQNPGQHGIFGFTDLHEGSYKTRFPSFRDVRCDTIFDRLGAAKMRSVVINQPATYPARPIHGSLVSGFVAIHLEKAVFPARHIKTAREMNYVIDLDAGEVRNNADPLFTRLGELLDSRRRMFDALWDDEKWNLMEVIVTGTDRLHHFMFDAWEDPAHPQHQRFLDYYGAVDAFIGHVHDRFSQTRSPENFFILSDHGFCQTRHEAYPNAVLAAGGYLSLDAQAADPLETIRESSRAFALDPGRIYVHRRGRFPRGSVAESDVPAVKEELKALFNELRHEGNPVVRHVFDGDDVYDGPEKKNAPDLLLVPHNGYDLKGRVALDAPVGARRLQGMHTWDDAFFLTTRVDLVPKRDHFNLIDVPRMLLQSLDVD